MTRPSVQSRLGATHPVGGEQLTLFIPDQDRLGRPIDQDHWTDEALDLLGRLFRGATAFPPGKGVWRDDSRGGRLLREMTVMVVSYVPRAELDRNLDALRTFLYRFGREANQGEVGIVIDRRYYAISKFETPDTP